MMLSRNYLIMIFFTLCLINLCIVSGAKDNPHLTHKRTTEPVDGGWGSWGDWSEYGDCPVNCGTGFVKSSRHRECNNPPPSDDGNDCVGDILETNVTVCSSDDCPGNGNDITGSIFRWSPCLPVCGSGIKIRARGACDPEHKHRCLNRKVFWEIRDCTKICKRRIKRFSFHRSVTHNSNGDTTYTAGVNTPHFHVAVGVTRDSRRRLSGVGANVGGNYGAFNAGANLGYSKGSGLSVGATGGVSGPYAGVQANVDYSRSSGLSAGITGNVGVQDFGASGGYSYNFRDRSSTFHGSAQAGSVSVRHDYNTRSGPSYEYGIGISGRRKRNVRPNLIEDEICERSGETMFTHPENCKMFIVCHDGVAYVESCPDEETWNDAARRCDSENTCEI